MNYGFSFRAELRNLRKIAEPALSKSNALDPRLTDKVHSLDGSFRLDEDLHQLNAAASV
jgi:hypothetical protein